MTEQKKEPGIRKRADGGWSIRTSATDPKTGKILFRKTQLPPGTTMQEARRVREKLKAEIRVGRGPTRPVATITLADYSEQWLERAATRLKASTLNNYVGALSYRVLPVMGEYRLAMITRGDVDAWARDAENQTAEDGTRYSTDTVRSWWRVLLQVLRDAHAEGHIKVDPTLRVAPPDTGERHRRERRTLSVKELGDLLKAAETIVPDRYAEIATLAWTGMRTGELYALTWEDVDVSGGRIWVRRSVWRGSVGTTKTSAEREVPLSELLAKVLEEHRRHQIREQVPGLDTGLVFPSNVGTYRTSCALRKPLELSAEAAEIDQHVSPQVLRRTWNTLLVAAGVDRIVVRSMLGHSSEEMTERYSGVRLERKKEAVARLHDLTHT